MSLQTLIVEWRCWPKYVTAVAATPAQWQADMISLDCGWSVTFTNN